MVMFVAGRRRRVAELADVADGRFGDGQLLVVHVAEDGVMVAVGVGRLGDLDARSGP